MDSVLVTGAGSGLGAYCARHFNADKLTRETDFSVLAEHAEQQPYDVIIHAAFNTKRGTCLSTAKNYFDDNIALLQNLLALPHKKFVYISTVDIYPKNNKSHSETEDVCLDDIDGLYGLVKSFAESLVQAAANQPLVLRPTAMLGVDAKPNSLVRILTQPDVKLSLSSESTFNYVLHSDIADFIAKAYADELTGIYNMAATENISLATVAEYFNKPVNFGNYIYQTGNIDTSKWQAVYPKAKANSLQVIERYLQQVSEYELA